MKTRYMLFKLDCFNIVSAIFLICLILLSISCKKDDTIPVELKIGLSYQGGIIFNLDATGKHGLIAATSDQSSTDTWWNGSFVTTGATNMTNGFANTTKIINAQGNSGTYAARLCTNYRGGDYSDWFLPSKDQLNFLYLNKSIIGGFSDNIYWSSTEYDLGEAWVQDFSTGEQNLDNISDGANVHTRAIRAF
jgi:hypothetical protein